MLADDNMEGRDTGSDGLRRAEAYIVEQLKKNGVEPAGSDGYYQPVKFESREIIEKDSSAALVRDGKSEPLTLGEDVFFGTRVDLAPEVEAPLAFIGYGLKIPEQNYDDLAGLDLKGKVVVIFAGSTAETPAALSAHVDHLGIGAPINGDKIYNGAMDNASGDAVLLDVAASLRKSGEKLKRSVLCVRYGRRERIAGLEIFCDASDGAGEFDGRGH